eukprot:CAMPEP_0172375832 /NCGR_PEP_ID=MMETSP1060-20121228/63623_1 /TAXON_ID=37318 /ORGANISM="Pseudo-nitzschia pungens, Strain cf. cingulata" /LENGTH=348 /DNA_ID=CAMNT_0013103115 /DNA_START=163 /DNA_END=1209 /DNA_ORIENTATION=-
MSNVSLRIGWQRFGFLGLLALASVAFTSFQSLSGATPWIQPVGAFVFPSKKGIAVSNAVPKGQIQPITFLARDGGISYTSLPPENGSFGRETKTTRLSALPEFASMISGTYGTAILEYPLPTKSLTAGALCGIGDIVAQNRDSNNEQYNLQRTLRFASKGCVGGILWSFWYNQIDSFLSLQDDFDVGEATSGGVQPTQSLSLYALTGEIFSANVNASFLAFSKAHLATVTTVFSILIEQFFWCPLVYGTFEIPVSTLMNGGEISSILGQVKSKLNGLLVSNAKVWTLANLIIYNSPLEWRLIIGNCIDIFWQSIVSDVSADCGGPEQEECPVMTIPEEQVDIEIKISR